MASIPGYVVYLRNSDATDPERFGTLIREAFPKDGGKEYQDTLERMLGALSEMKPVNRDDWARAAMSLALNDTSLPRALVIRMFEMTNHLREYAWDTPFTAFTEDQMGDLVEHLSEELNRRSAGERVTDLDAMTTGFVVTTKGSDNWIGAAGRIVLTDSDLDAILRGEAHRDRNVLSDMRQRVIAYYKRSPFSLLTDVQVSEVRDAFIAELARREEP